jgi:hypothetical protein
LINFLSVGNNVVSFQPYAPTCSQSKEIRKFVRFDAFDDQFERVEKKIWVIVTGAIDLNILLMFVHLIYEMFKYGTLYFHSYINIHAFFFTAPMLLFFLYEDYIFFKKKIIQIFFSYNLYGANTFTHILISKLFFYSYIYT